MTEIEKMLKHLSTKNLEIVQRFVDCSDELYDYAKVKHWNNQEWCMALILALDRSTNEKDKNFRSLAVRILSD